MISRIEFDPLPAAPTQPARMLSRAIHDMSARANQDGADCQIMALTTMQTYRSEGMLLHDRTLCVAPLNIVDPTNSEALRGNLLPKPLPPVRIEVAQPTSWSDLISGLRALGFT